MVKNLLDELAEQPVPAPPLDFGRQVHRRLNDWLLAGQLIDLAVRGIPFAAWHFAQALFEALVFTMTGRTK